MEVSGWGPAWRPVGLLGAWAVALLVEWGVFHLLQGLPASAGAARVALAGVALALPALLLAFTRARLAAWAGIGAK